MENAVRLISLLLCCLSLSGCFIGCLPRENWYPNKDVITPSFAADEKLSPLLKELQAAGDCAKYWDILWPKAKAGDMEARWNMYFLMVSPPHMDILFAPSASQNYVTKMRNATIMAAHAYDYDGESPFFGKNEKAAIADYKETAAWLFKHAGFPEKKFMACVTEGKTKCTHLAVEEKLVPSFEDFAKEIDALMAQGIKSTCEYDNYGGRVKSHTNAQ